MQYKFRKISFELVTKKMRILLICGKIVNLSKKKNGNFVYLLYSCVFAQLVTKYYRFWK